MFDQLLALSQTLAGELFGLLQGAAPGRVRGAMLGVDDYWMEAVIRERLSHSGIRFGHLDDKYFWTRELWAESPPLPLDYRPPRRKEHCRAIGFPEGASPIYILAILRRPEAQTALADLPRTFQGHALVYQYWQPCYGLRGVGSYMERVWERLS